MAPTIAALSRYRAIHTLTSEPAVRQWWSIVKVYPPVQPLSTLASRVLRLQATVAGYPGEHLYR